MINIRSIKKLANNDGLTLKNGKPIAYKTGWQVATEGVEVTYLLRRQGPSGGHEKTGPGNRAGS